MNTHIVADQRGFSADPNNSGHPTREQSGLVKKRNLSADTDDEAINVFILAVAGMIETLDDDNEVGTIAFLHGVRAVVDVGDYSPEVRRRINILMERLFASVRVWKNLQ